MVTSVPWQLNSSERVQRSDGAERARRRPPRLSGVTDSRTPAATRRAAELVVSTGAAANGGSCVARHEGRVIFVRYALPGEQVRVRITGDRGSYWHAEAFEILEPSPDRVDSLCPIAGVDGSGCCDLAFAEPRAARELKGQVVANQLERLGDFAWQGAAEPVGDGGAAGLAHPGAPRRGLRRPGRVPPLPQRRAGHRSALRAAAGRHARRARRPAVAGRRAGACRPRRRRRPPRGGHQPAAAPHPGGRGRQRHGPARRPAGVAGAVDRFLAGPSRRRGDVQRTGHRVDPGQRCDDGVGSLRRCRSVRRRARRRGR